MTIWNYLCGKAADLAEQSLSDIQTAADWNAKKEKLYQNFMQSMGLHPLPERCDLRLTDYGEFTGKGYQARRVAYQLLPDCWGTGNIYIPDPKPEGRLPAVLYACGHSAHGLDNYQRHAVMWVKRGYVCMVFDTIEQHDNPGEHHGVPQFKRFDWISRGYTSAGGELWNSIRALDVLLRQPEVDPERVGVTGVSGGGSLSFYLAIADKRIKATAPCCGVSVPKYALYKRHLMSHCDCYYYQNIFAKDVSEYGALIAPRPLLLGFTTHDSLFSPPEFHFLHRQIQKVYKLLGVENNCKLSEYAGPHGYGFKMEILKDINDWFDQHLAGEPRPEGHLKNPDQPEKIISVFNGEPPIPNNLEVYPELLVPVRTAWRLPDQPEDWEELRASAIDRLRKEVFHQILNPAEKMEFEQIGDWIGSRKYRRYIARMGGLEMFLHVYTPEVGNIKEIIVSTTEGSERNSDLTGRLADLRNIPDCALVFLETRGTTMTEQAAGQCLATMRAGNLVGITPFMLKVQDLCQVLPFARQLPGLHDKPLCLCGKGESAVAAIYAALFTSEADGLFLEDLPSSHKRAAYTPGILQVMDIGHALGLLAPLPVAVMRPQHGRGTWAARAYERIGAKSKWLASVYNSKVAVDAVFDCIAGKG